MDLDFNNLNFNRCWNWGILSFNWRFFSNSKCWKFNTSTSCTTFWINKKQNKSFSPTQKFNLLFRKKKQKDGNPHFLFLGKKETKKARVSLIHSPPKKYYFKIIKTAFSKTLIFYLRHRCTKNQVLQVFGRN